MPILKVEIVTHVVEVMNPHLARELADRTAEVFGAEPGGNWVTVQFIPADNYAENGGHDTFPIFVSVLKARWPAEEALREEAARLAAVVAEVCRRPAGNVHIIYQPEGAGRVAFGGKLSGPD